MAHDPAIRVVLRDCGLDSVEKCASRIFDRFARGLYEVKVGSLVKDERVDVLPWHVSMAYLCMSDGRKFRAVRMWDTSRSFGDVVTGDGVTVRSSPS